MKKRWTAIGTLAGFSFAAGIGLFAFLHSGVYDIAATHPHAGIETTLIRSLKRNSVQFHARDLEVPELDDPQMIQRGFVLYRQNCVPCHGAPGEPRSRIGRGLNPNPPPLEKAIENWTLAEIAWITSHGIKMAGMPGFSLGEEPGDLWATTAFVARMNTLTPDEYRMMISATEGNLQSDQVQWLAREQGWSDLDAKGDKARGEELIGEFGCGTCHEIPGIPGANGTVGPPLAEWAKRHYIAGALNNSPRNLVPWLMDPQQIEPGTVMPNVGVSEQEAWDISAYLYTLGGDTSVGLYPPSIP